MASSMAMIRIAIPAIPSSSGYCARARGRVAAAGMRVRCSGGGGGGSEGKGDGEEGPESLVAAAEFERAAAAADGQRARSMALNSEGLEYFGPSFVHDASKTEVSPPPYIDPYELLEDERLSRPSPDVF
uniref:Uncharacterized protein n=1 Tax=Leersia perrieri TaxID=77586 RepID=A0A0D9XT05_9ORYZ